MNVLEYVKQLEQLACVAARLIADGESVFVGTGLPLVGGGPWRVISHLGLMGFDEDTRRMKLISYHPGVTPDVIQQFTGFELMVPEDVAETPKPTEEELRLLRQEVDPNRLYCF